MQFSYIMEVQFITFMLQQWVFKEQIEWAMKNCLRGEVFVIFYFVLGNMVGNAYHFIGNLYLKSCHAMGSPHCSTSPGVHQFLFYLRSSDVQYTASCFISPFHHPNLSIDKPSLAYFESTEHATSMEKVPSEVTSTPYHSSSTTCAPFIPSLVSRFLVSSCNVMDAQQQTRSRRVEFMISHEVSITDPWQRWKPYKSLLRSSCSTQHRCAQFAIFMIP